MHGHDEGYELLAVCGSEAAYAVSNTSRNSRISPPIPQFTPTAAASGLIFFPRAPLITGDAAAGTLPRGPMAFPMELITTWRPGIKWKKMDEKQEFGIRFGISPL